MDVCHLRIASAIGNQDSSDKATKGDLDRRLNAEEDLKESHLLSADQPPGGPVQGPALAVKDLLDIVTGSLEDDKAIDVTTIDLKGKSSIADFMVVASGRSRRQVGAISDHLLRRLKQGGAGSPSTEGLPRADWVLIDAGDVVVHIFRPEVRSFYNLEKMWSADLDAARS